MKKDSVFIIGAFGYKNNNLGGQTVKTRNIYEVLIKSFDVKYFDTDDLKYKPYLIFNLLLKSLIHKNIFYVGGQASLKSFFPILILLAKIRRSSIVYVTVGGWLYDFLVTNNGLYVHLIKQCKSVLVETKFLKNNLESLGLECVSLIPNFRLFSHYPECTERKDKTIRMVFMARVVKEKGIYLIFDLIEKLKGKINFTITFYGPLDESDRLEFTNKIKANEGYASYKGALSPDSIHSTLVNFDVLLLPTFHPGEGFPGTIVDAYISGIPVLTTRWKQIPEFIDEGKTGFLIDYDVDQLYEKVILLASDSDLLSSMKINVIQKSKEYSAQKGLEALTNSMFSK